MSFDEDLAARIRRVLAGRPDVTERRMFGGVCFLVGGSMACGIVKAELCVRCGPERHEEALSAPHTRPMDFTGKPMRGFVYSGWRWGLGLVATLLPGCFWPIPIHHYQPHAEGAYTVETSCTGNPPYAAEFRFGIYRLRTYFEGNQLVMEVFSPQAVAIRVEPSTLRVTAAGRALTPGEMSYFRWPRPESEMRRATAFTGPLSFTASSLDISVKLTVDRVNEFVVTLPRFQMGDTVLDFHDVVFVRKIHLNAIVINC